MNRHRGVLTIIFLMLLLVIKVSSCSSPENEEAAAYLDSLDDMETEDVGISEEVISDLMAQIPSPLEISVLLKESGTGYKSEILSSYDSDAEAITSAQKALNLGIYGTDLGYANVFEEKIESLRYLSALKSLADELRIGQFFDLSTFGDLVSSRGNFDSLLLITTQNFNDINEYLRKQKRANLSILLLAGGWIEALHITCQTAALNPDNVELQETIGEQKITLESIMLLLSFYAESNEDIGKLNDDMTNLISAFDQVTIEYTEGESTVEVVNGVMVIQDNSSSTINISDETLTQIIDSTKELRDKLI